MAKDEVVTCEECNEKIQSMYTKHIKNLLGWEWIVCDDCLKEKYIYDQESISWDRKIPIT